MAGVRRAAGAGKDGSRGKDRVTLRHVLLHTAGLPGLPPETTIEQLCDWDHMCAVLAAQEPWWEPGTRFGYHALTFGFLLGETMRRATGRTVTELLRQLLTGPLGVQDEVLLRRPAPPAAEGSAPARAGTRPNEPTRKRLTARPGRAPRAARRRQLGPAPTCSPPTSRPSAR